MSKWSKLQDVDLKLLRVFVIIVESGGFSAAQFALNLSKSTLSEYIKALETRLGVTLCQRGPKGFKLFDEGEDVYRAAREMFGAIETFQNTIIDINQGQIGNMTIAVQDGVIRNPASRLPIALQRFSDRYPGIQIIIETMLGYQVLGRVADGVATLGIAIRSSEHVKLEFENLFEEGAALFCGVSHPLFHRQDDDPPLRESELRGHRYCNRAHLEMELAYLAPRESAEIQGDVGWGGEAQLVLILSGRNIGYLDVDLARPYVERGMLKKLNVEGATSGNPVALVTGPHTRKFKLAQKFIGELRRAHDK